MDRVGIRQLRQSASAVLRRVAAGEIVEVTDRGHPVARIVPLNRRSTLDQLLSEGRADSAEHDLLADEPLEAAPGAASLSTILAEMRADER